MNHKLPLVLLPGTLCDARLFEHQLSHLTDVVVPQVIDVHRQDNLKDVASYVLAQVDGHFAVAGLSYGGIVALEICRQAPQRVTKLALLNTNPYAASEPIQQHQLRYVDALSADDDIRQVAFNFLKSLPLHPDDQLNVTLCNQVVDMSETIGITGFVNEIKAQLARPDVMSDLPNITCPTLVVAGRDDRIVPLPAHKAMAEQLPNGHLVVLDNCGHLTTIEQPERATQILRDWLTDDGIWKQAD